MCTDYDRSGMNFEAQAGRTDGRTDGRREGYTMSIIEADFDRRMDAKTKKRG